MARLTQQSNFHSAQRDELWHLIRNLPSDHILRIFDRYFALMIEPIALYTNAHYETLAEALVLLTNARRKITIQGREEVKATLFAAMHCPREEVTARLLKVSIERSLLLIMVYRTLEDDTVFCAGVDPEPLRRHLSLLLADFRLFKDLILNRYTRKIIGQSGSFAWSRRLNGLQIENDDAFQNHFMATLRALDKVDVEEGTITKYIVKWMKSAEHSLFNLYLGEAYSITRTVRTKIHRKEISLNNHSVLLDDALAASLPEEPTETASPLADLLATTLAVLQAQGEVRQYRLALLGLRAGYVPTPDDIAAQRSSVQ